MPTAPPRLLGLGFADEPHKDGLVQLAANPYAAMPSLHAADALIVGIVLAVVCRHWWAKVFWAIWPAWVWFAVMATGNHFWLDCIAGVARRAGGAGDRLSPGRSSGFLPLSERRRPPADPSRLRPQTTLLRSAT